jgi:hypothetical protein
MYYAADFVAAPRICLDELLLLEFGSKSRCQVFLDPEEYRYDSVSGFRQMLFRQNQEILLG